MKGLGWNARILLKIDFDILLRKLATELNLKSDL
jgi:hypothetical protein